MTKLCRKIKKSIDDQNELFTVVNKNDEIIGYEPREKCHKDKTLIHRSAIVIIYNDKKEILMQKRSKNKDLYPEYFTLGASGHIAKGESYEEAAKREMKEELGIDIPLKYIDKILVEFPSETEMLGVFEGYYNGPYNIDINEVDFVKFYKKEDIIESMAKGIMQITPCAKKVLEII